MHKIMVLNADLKIQYRIISLLISNVKSELLSLDGVKVIPFAVLKKISRKFNYSHCL